MIACSEDYDVQRAVLDFYVDLQALYYVIIML